MPFRQPARTAARGTRITVYRRRRRTLLGTVLALLLAVAALAALPHLLDGKARTPTTNRTAIRTLTSSINRAPGTSRQAVTWPQQGQAALVLGGGRPAASPHEVPVPIASVAKVMTAYLTLERYPLSVTQAGFTMTVTEDQAQDAAQDAAQNQSRVPVQPGEQLTERQLLEALLIPSGNNIAEILAGMVAGSEARFLAEMNAEARALGMDHTIYTDPSGFDPSTVSTAADQLRVFQRAMRFAVFRQIVSMPSVTLPVAGTLTNYDPLIVAGYAGKTGSDSAAGGCLAFFTNVTVAGREQTAVGVVLGQGQGDDTSMLLGAAGDAVEQLVASVDAEGRVRTLPPPGAPRGAPDS
ncbi:MAG TPA: hypothetical protein VHX66_08600 [Solirubrobacteraceae bacterium]|jgi:D-alanyl-D-alanine carboxypeptidase (penicillin-binding protein 5/6)|nr:hypothetical protein [Solirubrobacteraceae bacterium]